MKRSIFALGALALALALAGGAWAGNKYIITSSHQVKPGALTGGNIKNHSLSLADLSGSAHAQLHGAQGATGQKGDTGTTGSQGLQGVTGVTGAQGLQGITGAQGNTGSQGSQGVAGSTGATGAQGSQGATGSQGSQGDTGPQGPQGALGPQGPQGPAGAAGASGFAGAFYSVQTYTETIGVGAIATAACDPNDATNSQNYVAISGGVQDTDSGTDMTTNDNQVAIAASFPGRMDFNTFTPKPFRLDGWIVQFAHVGQQDNNLAVWALCVPVSDFGGNIPVHTN